MKKINSYIIEKLHIDKDIEVIKQRTDDEIRKDSLLFVEKWLKDNTEYKDREDDYDMSIKNDYLFLLIYSPDKKELEEIGEKLTLALKKENLIGEYDWYELGSTNKTHSYKKLVFNLNIHHVISRDDFNKTTFKRSKRY